MGSPASSTVPRPSSSANSSSSSTRTVSTKEDHKRLLVDVEAFAIEIDHFRALFSAALTDLTHEDPLS